MFGKEKSSDERRFRVAPDVSTEMVGERASAAGVLLFSAVLFVVVLACVLGVGALATGRVTLGACRRGRAGGAARHRLLPCRPAVGARGGAAPRALQPRVGAGAVLDHPRHRVEHHAGGHAHAGDDLLRRGDADSRPGSHERGRRAVLARVGRRRGLHRGGRLHPCCGDGRPDGPARRHRRRAPPRWPSVASSWIGSSNGCWRRRWRPGV